MTKFKGPLKVGTQGAPGTEVDYVTIDTSGTASFAGPLTLGPSGQTGLAVLVQRTTIAANVTAGAPAIIVLPAGSDIVDITYDVEIPFATAVGVSACNLEISAAGGVQIAVIRTTASTTRYGLTSNADAFNGGSLRNVTATIEAHASIVGSNTAMTVGQGMLSIHYVQNS